MRKTVVDGSNTSGFQRTALISRGGKISTSEGEVHIENVSLEEDACKIVSEIADEKIYRLDRLGIPLIEVGTAPDIKTPQQAQETAKKLGLLLRSLTGVKRGLGTIRQDVNVSIAGGARIEIKGAQDLRMLPQMVEYEIERQKRLLELKEKIKLFKLNDFKIFDLTDIFKHTSSNILRKALDQKGKILGIRLNDFSGLIGRELQPNYRVGTELSGRAKIKAGVGGIFHSDELPNYGITEREIEHIRKQLHCLIRDAFILVADEELKARKALEAVYERAEEFFTHIPKEVRKANPDGTSSFMRPMPGAARMYPETDVPLIKPNLKRVKIPETLEEKMQRYQKRLGLGKDLAEFIAKSDKVILFDELVEKYPKIKPAFIAETLTSILLEIKRKYNLDPELLEEDNFRELFLYLSQDKIHKDIVLPVLIEMLKKEFDLKKYESLSIEELHKRIMEVIKEHPEAPFPALMGMCVKKLEGKASGKMISENLNKILEQGHK